MFSSSLLVFSDGHAVIMASLTPTAMFGMTLIQALHAKGLASCCMNWSKTRDVGLRLRRLMTIPEAESIVFLLGVGHPREEFLVAASARKPLSDVLRVDEDQS